MKIAIQAADLDAPRIDGTRVYILNCLKYFGKLDSSNEFLIYHKGEFNPELTPPDFSNYKIIKKSLPYFWTQSRFAHQLWTEKPDVLWMPMHNIPILKRRGLKTVVTIHDLAFKYFPEAFTKKDLLKINLLTRLAITHSDKIITVSESSKRDILKFYPQVKPEKIRVIYHGFDKELYEVKRDLEAEKTVKEKYGITGNYILYIGAIQPRKNLEVLVDAFEKAKKKVSDDFQLVFVGEKAWLSDSVFDRIEKSECRKDIITPGRLPFSEIGHMLRGASAFVFPSLYEGFGIPVLEAMASDVPVICAKNSSLPEVGGDASLYFDGQDSQLLSEHIQKVMNDQETAKKLIEKGREQIKKFSWQKTAQETLDYLKS